MSPVVRALCILGAVLALAGVFFNGRAMVSARHETEILAHLLCGAVLGFWAIRLGISGFRRDDE